MTKTKTKKKLTPKQEKFCKIYATSKEFFGNGTQTYLEVFSTKKKPITYKSARTQASILLTNHNILEKINALIEITLNDQHVDKQLALVVTQCGDLKAKVSAIKEYNQLKKRITKHVDVTTDGKAIEGFKYLIPNGSNNNSNA